jgi:hypothetical protein
LAKQLRLLKVAVTPVFVVDDGETLTELSLNPPTIVVAAQEWPTFAEGRFLDLVEDLSRQVQEGSEGLGLPTPAAE